MKSLKNILVYVLAALLILTAVGLTVSLIRGNSSDNTEEPIESTVHYINVERFDYEWGQLVITYEDGTKQYVDMEDFIDGLVYEATCDHEWISYDYYTLVEATCENRGLAAEYCRHCGEIRLVEIDYAEHTYSALTWIWADDYSTAMLQGTCSVCGETTLYEAAVTSETTDTEITYTATVTVNGEVCTSTKTVAIDSNEAVEVAAAAIADEGPGEVGGEVYVVGGTGGDSSGGEAGLGGTGGTYGAMDD